MTSILSSISQYISPILERFITSILSSMSQYISPIIRTSHYLHLLIISIFSKVYKPYHHSVPLPFFLLKPTLLLPKHNTGNSMCRYVSSRFATQARNIGSNAKKRKKRATAFATVAPPIGMIQLASPGHTNQANRAPWPSSQCTKRVVQTCVAAVS